MDIASFQRSVRDRISHGLVKGSAFSLSSQVIVSGSNFFTGVIIAKAMGASDFGIYSIIAATILALQGIQQALITSPMIFMARAGKENTDRISQYFILQIMLSLPLAIGAAVAIEMFLGQWSLGQLVAIIGAVLFLQIQEFSRTRLYIDLRATDVLTLDIVNHGLRLTLLLLLWRIEWLTVSSAFMVLALASAISGLRIISSLNSQSLRACLDNAKNSFQYGRWVLLESFAYYLSVPFYLYLSSALLSHEATGGLSAAISLLNLPSILTLGLMNLAIPVARQKLLNEGYEAWRLQLINTGLIVTSISVFIYIAISASGPYLLSILYSSEFAKFADLLPIVATYYCLLVLGSVLAAAFRLAHAPQIGAATKLWSSIITACIAYPLINGWGLMGAASGLVVTSATWLAVYAIYIYKGALRADKVLEQRFGT